MSLAKHVSIFFKADTKGFQSGLDNMSKRLKKFSRQTQKLGRSITRNISVPFALAGAAAVKMVSEFDTSMTKINTLVGVSEGQIKKFKEQVLELSGKVAQSPKDLADGLFFLTSAGLKGANAMETLESVSKGVAIGLGEQTDLAKVAGAAQNAYGKDVLSASESLDIFGKMVKTGMFESSELAGVLGKEAGFAAALGISFEELGAFISTYTRTTGDATSATVGVSGVMMAFTKQTDKGEKALGRINTTYGEVKQMLGEQGLQKTLIHLKQRFAEENVEMSEFFSKSQSLKGVINVLGNQTGEYVNILGELKDSTGFVNDGFEVVAETTGFKMKKAFNDLKLAMMEFGVVLIPIAETLAGAISKIAEKFKGLDSSTKETFGYIAVALAAAGPILLGVSLLSSGIASATKAVGLLRGAFVALAANPALIAVGIAMAVAMQQINETTEAIDEQGKTVTKLTEGAKGWMKIWGIVKWMIGKVGEQLGITAQVIGKIAESMNHMVNLRFGKAGDSLKEAFDTVKKTEFLAFGKWGKEIEGVLADVEEQIGLKDYELNKPKADPKSAEELQDEIQKQLNLLSPLVVPLDTGGGG
jgi:TP901 family phage tail tape measure protein